MRQTELLAIGGAYVDINCAGFPFDERGLRPETEVVGSDYMLELGGSAVNFARLCSSLDLPAAFVGKIGNDKMGTILSDLLEKAGVQPELIIDGAAVTNVGFNMVNPAGKTIMAVVGSANQSLTPDEVQERASELLPNCNYLFIGGCFKLKSLMPAFVQLAKQARDSHTKIVLDHARLSESVTDEEKETVRQLAAIADYYLPSADEFQQLWDAPSIADGLRSIAGKHEGIIVVKDSERGAITLIDEKVVTVPAYKVQPIHTVGAGDSFDAGFIAAQSQGMGLLDSIQFACATSALKISRPTLPTYESVESFIAHHAG